jgi:hypothetical protein
MEKERKDDRYRYKVEIQQMMFVSGDTNDPPAETTQLIEDIVRSQVVEIVSIGSLIVCYLPSSSRIVARTRGVNHSSYKVWHSHENEVHGL